MIKGVKARLLTVLGVVVLLVVAGIVAATVAGDGGANGEDDSASKQESKPEGALDERWRSGRLPGWEPDDLVMRMWTVEDTVVVVSTGGVWGFDADTGKRRWETEIVHAASAPCAASESVNAEGIGVVLFSTETDGPSAAARCGALAGAVDTASGELLWTEELPDFDSVVGPPRVTVGDKVITVDPDSAFGPEYHFRFSLKGKKLPLPEIPDGGDCHDRKGWLQGLKYTVAMNMCEQKLTAYGTQDGKKLWTLGDTPITPHKIITEEPLTIAGDMSSGADMVSFDDGGSEIRAEIEVPRTGAGPRLVQADASSDTVLVTSLAEGGFAAVDLDSGEEYWRDSIPGMAVGTGDEYLLALAFAEPDFAKRTPGDYDCRLIRLDARTGKQHEEGILPCPYEPDPDFDGMPPGARATELLSMPVGALADDDSLFTVDVVEKGARVVAHELS